MNADNEKDGAFELGGRKVDSSCFLCPSTEALPTFLSFVYFGSRLSFVSNY